MLKREIVVIGDRPTSVWDTSKSMQVEIPEGYEIWNAPRPLFGEFVWSDTEGRTGWFHGAFNPYSRNASNLRDANIRLDARKLSYLSVQECAKRQFDHMKEKYDEEAIRQYYNDEVMALNYLYRVNQEE